METNETTNAKEETEAPEVSASNPKRVFVSAMITTTVLLVGTHTFPGAVSVVKRMTVAALAHDEHVGERREQEDVPRVWVHPVEAVAMIRHKVGEARVLVRHGEAFLLVIDSETAETATGKVFCLAEEGNRCVGTWKTRPNDVNRNHTDLLVKQGRQSWMATLHPSK